MVVNIDCIQKVQKQGPSYQSLKSFLVDYVVPKLWVHYAVPNQDRVNAWHIIYSQYRVLLDAKNTFLTNLSIWKAHFDVFKQVGDIGVLVLAMLDSQTLLTNKYAKIKVIMLHNFATILELDKKAMNHVAW